MKVKRKEKVSQEKNSEEFMHEVRADIIWLLVIEHVEKHQNNLQCWKGGPWSRFQLCILVLLLWVLLL